VDFGSLILIFQWFEELLILFGSNACLQPVPSKLVSWLHTNLLVLHLISYAFVLWWTQWSLEGNDYWFVTSGLFNDIISAPARISRVERQLYSYE
jgi:hypothetical protein